MSSRELTEWRAYERVVGPLGRSWVDGVQADMHEILQGVLYLTSQAHFTDKQHREGPAPKPVKVTRPGDLYSEAVKSAEAEWYAQEVVPPRLDEEDENDEVRT